MSMLSQTGDDLQGPKAETQIVRQRTTVYNLRVPTWTASEARAALPEILDRVADGEEAVITRHGKPVAVVVNPDVLRVRHAASLIAEADAIRARLDAARRAPRPERALSRRRADQLAREMRADRDR